MKSMKLGSLTAIAALALTASPPTFAGTPVPLKVSGQDAAKGVTQVAIGAFNVGFIFQSVDSTKAMDGLSGWPKAPRALKARWWGSRRR